MVRRITGWAFAALVVALAVLSFAGDIGVFAAYVILLTGSVAFHAGYSCRRCNNVSCTFNPASPECMFGRRYEMRSAEETGMFSDINASVAGIPLLIALAVGFFGTYMLSVWALATMLAWAFVTAVLYTIVTCSFCANRCPNNRNAAYKEWRRGA